MTDNNIASTETVQPKVETNAQDKVLDRLSKDFGGETINRIEEPVKPTETPKTDTPEVNSETPTEPTPEEIDALKGKAKELGLPETATKEEVEAAQKAKDDTEWKVEEVVKSPEEENDGSWKGLFESFGFPVPADYAEENGFELFQNAQKAHIEAEIKKGTEEAKYDRYVDVPEAARGEAELLVEQMKAGQSLEKIIEPLIQVAQFKSMGKEELVRSMYESKDGWDAEMVDAQMQKIVEGGQLEVEYKIAKAMVDNYEQSLTTQRKTQIETYKNNQKAIQEQRTSKSNLELKVALDRVPEFLGKKLPDNLKSQLLSELQTERYRNMPGTPEQKIDYFLYNKFGKTAMKNFQDRALEKVVIENKQKQHNVPPVQNGAVNRIEPTSTKSVAEQRLEQQFGGR